MEKEQEDYASRLTSRYPTVRCSQPDASGNVVMTPGTDADEGGEGFVPLGQAYVVSVDGICVRREVTA